MEKDISIQDLVVKLRSSLGPSNFQVVDHWEDDQFSIGFAHPKNIQLLVYVSTFDTHGFYFAITEFPPKLGEGESNLPYTPGSEYVNVDFDGLLNIINAHFKYE